MHLWLLFEMGNEERSKIRGIHRGRIRKCVLTPRK
jgi:hypothetical protein